MKFQGRLECIDRKSKSISGIALRTVATNLYHFCLISKLYKIYVCQIFCVGWSSEKLVNNDSRIMKSIVIEEILS